MLTYILRRLLATPPLLLVISLLTFLLLKASPGDFFQQLEEDPAKTLAYVMGLRVENGLAKLVAPEVAASWGPLSVRNPRADSEGEPERLTFTFSPTGGVVDAQGELLNGMRAKSFLSHFTYDGVAYRLDERGNVYVGVGAVEGYIRWLRNTVTRDAETGKLRLGMGTSYTKQRPVGPLILERVANTLILSIASLIFAWGLAVPLGVFAAVRPNSLLDHCCGFVAYFGLSIPSVFFAMLAILFASYTGWFPVGNMRDLTRTDLEGFAKWADVAHHLVLPTIVIGTGSLAAHMRQLRGEMVETLSKDYVRTARAKGLAPQRVLFKHALRNAINPLITIFGFSLAALLSGSFLVEVVMNWPGMARLVVDAVFARDEPLVMASVMMAAALLVAGNLVADLMLAMVDPRIRLS